MITLSTELKFTHTVKYQRLLICRISSINRFLEVTFFLKFLHHIKKKTEAHLKPCHDYKSGQIELLNQKTHNSNKPKFPASSLCSDHILTGNTTFILHSSKGPFNSI